MANPNQRLGKAFISIDGTLYETMTGATLENITGVTREEVSGASVFGYAEKAVAPKITCKFAHSSGMSLTLLANVTNSTVQFACDDGPVYGLNSAWSNAVKLTASSDGGVECEFYGKTCTELLSAL